MTLQKRTLKTDVYFFPYQSVNSFPGCLGHLQLIQDRWEDGAILSPVDLQRACAHDLHPILVERDCQVVWNLAPNWYDAATACLEKTCARSATGVPSTRMKICAVTASMSSLRMINMTVIVSSLWSIDNNIKLCHKEINRLSSDFPGTYMLKSM